VNANQPVRIGTGTNWTVVACGNYHTLARKVDGTLCGWGDNQSGQIAQPVSWLPAPVLGTNDWRVW
jgi:alpha-tubulin suppressor-like RCC1 family protein